MRTPAISYFRGAFAATMLAFGLFQPAAAEEATIRAFAVWHGQGEAAQTGPDEATFVGTLTGMVYVQTDKGPVASGRITCPALIKIKFEDTSQTANGRCTVTGEGGAQFYADIDCSGFHLVGCRGETKLTGGSGRFAGITGGGIVVVRTDQRAFHSASDGPVEEAATGIMYWPALRYSIP